MTLNRRKLLKWGAGVMVAIPAALQIRWLTKDFTRPNFAAKPPAAPNGRRVWRNWSGLHFAHPMEIYSAPSETELAAKIATWPGRIRPVGASHSFSPLVPTDDLLVDIGRLSGLISVDIDKKIAVFGAGTRLRQAAKLAAKHGLGFPNLPDIDVQTLAGSFATATHGTGRNLGALHRAVLAFRIITASGEVLDVSRENNPDLFAAGVVSLGALGVITQYTLQLVDNYALRRKLFIVPTHDAIAQMYDLAKKHRNFEYYVLPNVGYAAMITHDLYKGKIEGRPPSEDEDWLTTLRDIRDILGWSPWLRQKAFAAYVGIEVPKNGMLEDTTDEYWKLLATARATKMNELEYHLPEENAQTAIREVVAAMEARKETFFPMEVRFTDADDAWLSPFSGGRRVSLAVHKAHDENYQTLFDVVEPIVRKHGGRPHWGKLHSLGAGDLAPLYPKFGDFAALRRDMDPAGKFLNAHTAKLFGAEFDT